jgi:hypothetical protein
MVTALLEPLRNAASYLNQHRTAARPLMLWSRFDRMVPA